MFRALRPLLFSFLLLWLVGPLAGGIPAGDYAGIAGLTGDALKGRLHDIIQGHTQLPYNSSSQTDTRDALKRLEQDPENAANVLLFHIGRSDPKTQFGQANGWDHEPLWPRSDGVADTPAETDLSNLRVTDRDVNNARASKYFDFSDPAAVDYRSPAHAEAPGNTSDFDSGEPLDTYKGDVARSLFCLDVRYEGGGTEPDLRLTDNRALITNSGMYLGLLSTLMAWHALDPVDAAKRQRNDRICSDFQSNRSPFIDHPEWVAAVYAPVPEWSGQTAATAAGVMCFAASRTGRSRGGD
ncbi:MAG: endonuclease [Verrucomicrobia bacterium]|nr:endonuclease [Verrucomicrobiota bacterium]